jgi:hypothetical protein
MPLLHWHYYSFLKKVFNRITDFATNFGNLNFAAENSSISELNSQPLILAITTMREFEDNIIRHQSLGMPIVTMVSSIKAYCLMVQ